MMGTLEIKKLIIKRHQRFGFGLCGRFEVIARWLFKKYNIVTTDSYVASVIREWQEQNRERVIEEWRERE